LSLTPNAYTNARSKVVVSKDALIESLVCHRPGPGTSGLTAKETFWARGLLEHAVLVHGLHFVAGGVSEEVLEVFVFKGKSVAGDSCIEISKVT
jgi:hypothetical protein